MAVFDIFIGRMTGGTADRFHRFLPEWANVCMDTTPKACIFGAEIFCASVTRERAPVFVELRTYSLHPGKLPELTRAPAEHGAPW
jgi:hypothetical protein